MSKTKTIDVVAQMTEQELADYNKLMEEHGDVLDRACQAFAKAGMSEGLKDGKLYGIVGSAIALLVGAGSYVLLNKFKK